MARLQMLMISALLGLAACGSSEEKAVDASSSDTERAGAVASAVAGAATGMVSTADLPDFVEMYEGGTPVMNMKTADGGNKGGLFSYSVDAPLADVVAFHRQSAEKAGIAISTEMAAQDSLTFGGADKDETRRLLTTISKGEDGVTVSLTYSLPG
ncbi:hypothetical protein [Polymorphobacter sp.]|uniref:hypothetical protein n=1 Tax=Polymorphobacter sp. TaxID=1909290 RepID=UPI003F7207DA